MSKVIQTKLQTLKFDRKKSQNFSKIQLPNTLTNKSSSLDIKRSGNKPSFFSSSSYSNSYSDDNDLPISADRRFCYSVDKKETHTSAYHTYSEGSFKHLGKIRSNQFQVIAPPSSSPQIPNTVEENKIQKEKSNGNIEDNKSRHEDDEEEEGTISSETTEETDDSINRKSKKSAYKSIPIITISPDDRDTVQDDNDGETDYNDDEYDDDNYSRETSDSLLYYSSEEEDDDDDQVIQYNHLNPPQIHIAVRRDASLFKIEKISRENMTPAFNLAEVPKISNLTQKAEIDENQNWVFSTPKLKNQVLTSSAGIMTPPESPECQYNKLSGDSSESATFEMDNGLCFIHVQKRAHRSIKSFITGTYQLNHLTVTKVNSSISPYPGLHSAIDNSTRKSKLLLKIIIVSLTKEASEEQRRFGFTFWWHKSVSSRNQEPRLKLQDDAKFAIAPDSLVKESLVTWIGSQNQTQGEGIQLPCLSKADSIMRDGKKIYVVYDPSLFLV